jgi:hypothetical protein
MRSRRARTSLAVTAAVMVCGGALATACGEERAHSAEALTPYAANGLTVELPPGWQAAPASLTPHLADPRERLSVGTFPLRYRAGDCAHVPVSALEDLGPADAFVTLEERGTGAIAGVPARPARFGPDLGGPSEASTCAPGAHFTDHWFMFDDGGRRFHVLVAFGPSASADTQAQAWHILDGLRVDPAMRPDWSSAG